MIDQTISHYKIIEKLGEGGMGVVYKAQDTKLDRFVALKFLPSHLNASDQDKARFVQEAKAASALNHPNVCTIHDILENDGQMFIVMEYVDGQTLQEKKHSVSLKQAIDIGVQIADGLAAAHEKGIVHRDVKPENIMIRKDGITQIMDFGLAKLHGVSRLTKEGSTVGTAGYMSPEQVQGLDADHRADIFSFGVVLYELLVGQLPFKGVHETALAYEIVNVDPAPMSSVKPEIDPALDAIVLECLEKDPNERTQSMKQVAIDLKRFKRESSRSRMSRITAARPSLSSSRIGTGMESSPARVNGRVRIVRLPWIISGILSLSLLALAWVHLREGSPAFQVISANILPPAGWSFYNDYDGGHIALSPDGGTLAFVSKDSAGGTSLWVRPIAASFGQRLTDTEGATYPFWSPDSRFIGFFAGGKVKKVLASGAPPISLCDAPAGRGGSWNQDGVILFSPKFDQTGLYRVSASGGDPVAVTTVDTNRNETNHRWPLFLPDGKHFLYSTQAATGRGEHFGTIYLAELGSSASTLLVKVSSNLGYSNGVLVFVRQGILVAQRIDLSSYTLVGDAIPVSENIEYSLDKNKGVFSCSQNGILVYQMGHTLNVQRALDWYDRGGRRQNIAGSITATYAARLSPDGTKVVFDAYDPQAKTNDIWIHDFSRSLSTRFTFNRAEEDFPVWSSDGRRIIFSSDKTGHSLLYWKDANGTEAEQLLLDSPDPLFPNDCSADGRNLVYGTYNPKTNYDVWALPLDGNHKPVPLLQTEFDEHDAVISSDSRWVAYSSTESGRSEVYVRPFPTGSGKWQISTQGGRVPKWRKDSRESGELFFLSNEGTVMSVKANGTGSTFVVGSVSPLFSVSKSFSPELYDVTRDGQRFLIGTVPGGAISPTLTLVSGWQEKLKK
jgi:serine/threonine protein kinase